MIDWLIDWWIGRRNPRRRYRRKRTVRAAKWLLVGIAILALLGLILWAVWRVPQLLYAYVPDAKDRATVEATTRSGLIAALAGLAALGSLAVTNRTYRLSQQGQLTDRYSKAIEQLGQRSSTFDWAVSMRWNASRWIPNETIGPSSRSSAPS